MAARKTTPKVAKRPEILVLLSTAARGGNVPAMRLLLEELRLDGIEDDTTASDFIDELAKKREAALG